MSFSVEDAYFIDPTQIFVNKNTPKLVDYCLKLEKTILENPDLNIKEVEYNFVKNVDMNFYGDQEIFNLYREVALEVVKILVDQEIHIFDILIYIGLRRYDLAHKMNTLNADEYGVFRTGSGDVETFLTKTRNKDMRNFFKRYGDMVSKNFEGTEYIAENENTLILTNNQEEWSIINFYPEINPESSFAGTYTDKGRPTEEYYKFISDLYLKILSNPKIEDIARLHWYLCVKTPFIKGGGFLPEILCGALLKKFYTFSHWDPNYEPWSQAISSGIDRFIEIYPELSV